MKVNLLAKSFCFQSKMYFEAFEKYIFIIIKLGVIERVLQGVSDSPLRGVIVQLLWSRKVFFSITILRININNTIIILISPKNIGQVIFT